MSQLSGAVCTAPVISACADGRGRALLRRFPAVLAVALIACVAGISASMLMPPRFTAGATLLLAEGRGAARVGDTPSVAAAIMASPDFAREVVARLGAETTGRLRGDAAHDALAFARRWLPGSVTRNAADSEADRVAAFLRAFAADPADEAGRLAVTVRADEAEAAARAANAAVRVYIERRQAAVAERDSGLHAATLRLAAAQQALQAGLDAATAFRADPAGDETARRARAAAGDLDLLIAERAALTSERAAVTRRLASVEVMNASDDLFRLPSGGADLLGHLVEQRLTLRAELAAERRIRAARHWRVRLLAARAADLDDQIVQARGSALDRLASERDHFDARIGELEAGIRLRQAIIAAADDNSRRQEALDREVERARLQLALDREKLRDETDRVREEARAARVLTMAQAPDTPDRAAPVGVGLAAALLAALSAASLLGARPRTPVRSSAPPGSGAVSSAADEVRPAEQAARPDVSHPPEAETSPVGPPVAAPAPPEVLPGSPFAAVRVAGGAGDALDAVLARLAVAPRADRGRRLLVLAAGGAPEAAANALARRLALQERVILLDLVGAEEREAGRPGFADLVEGRASFAEIIARDPGSRLHRMERGQAAAAGLPAGDAAELALAALDQTYDWIVAAAPADDTGDLADRLIRRADGVVLAAPGDAVDMEVFAAYEALRERGIDNIVVALTGG